MPPGITVESLLNCELLDMLPKVGTHKAPMGAPDPPLSQNAQCSNNACGQWGRSFFNALLGGKH
jgi:hypothetical protein